MPKPGNFALIEEIRDSSCVPLIAVDSTTTAKRVVRQATRKLSADEKAQIEFRITRFTNHKSSYQWVVNFVPDVGLWCWTKTYRNLFKLTFTQKQLMKFAQQ